MEPRSSYQRLPSTELTIQEILEGDYVRDENGITDYLLTKEKEKVAYTNLVGNILRKEVVGTITNLWIDDGTGQIVLRFFEEHQKAKELNVGDIVLVIGKPRQYNDEKYLSPEIISKVDFLWLKIRSLKLQFKNSQRLSQLPAIPPPTTKSASVWIEPEIIEEGKVKKEQLPADKIAQLIKELDRGLGVPVEAILEQSALADTEQILKRMLERGEIFQNAPGKVKVL